MKRFAIPLVIGGSVTVLVALVLLLRAITTESPAATATTAPPPPRATERTRTATPSAPTGGASASPALPGRPPAVSADRAPSAPVGEAPPNLAVTPSDDALPGTRANTKGLHFGLPAMREKIAANTPQIAACLGGRRVTADVTLTLVAAQRAEGVVIESVDVDGDKTTLQDNDVLECMTKATQSIQLDGLPREASAIVITRAIKAEDGAITEDTAPRFSYLR